MIRFETMLTKYNLYAWALTSPTKISVVSMALLLEIDVTNKSSLDLYQYFYIKQGKQVYLDNQNDFKAS